MAKEIELMNVYAEVFRAIDSPDNTDMKIIEPLKHGEKELGVGFANWVARFVILTMSELTGIDDDNMAAVKVCKDVLKRLATHDYEYTWRLCRTFHRGCDKIQPGEQRLLHSSSVHGEYDLAWTAKVLGRLTACFDDCVIARALLFARTIPTESRAAQQTLTRACLKMLCGGDACFCGDMHFAYFQEEEPWKIIK